MSTGRDISGHPRPFTAGGRTYQLHPLKIQEIVGDLQAWVDAQFPDPMQIASQQLGSGVWNTTQQKLILEIAMTLATRARHLIGTPEADRLVQSADGIIQILLLSIRRGDPSFSEEDARQLFRELKPGDLEAVLMKTEVSMAMHDPKAGPPTKTPSGPGTSRSRRQRRAASTGGSSSTTR